MLFNSLAFLVLFTLFISVYYLIEDKRKLRLGFVLLFSVFFYYKSSGYYVGFLLGTILFDYWVALQISKVKKQEGLVLLVLSISVNLGLLAYFKYSNFGLQTLGYLNGKNYDLLDIFLPIGISFYTFQAISYVTDCYRRKIEPSKSLLDYAFYMTFFPHLVAGPIVRAVDFLPQVQQNPTVEYSKSQRGLFLILKGLIKKAILADFIAQYADLVFANPLGFNALETLLGIYTYTLQIYCDFSGYTDMAIGLALLMGYELNENFKNPYHATSPTDFWHRWHISLSTWLRDYLYIPLGGNRYGSLLTQLNLLVTMLLGGLWHGASLKFILWGAVHGLALVIHKQLDKVSFLKSFFEKLFIGRWLAWLITFHLVAFCWVPFRAADMETTLSIFQSLFWGWFPDTEFLVEMFNQRYPFILIFTGGLILYFLPERIKVSGNQIAINSPILFKFIGFIGAIVAMLLLGQTAVQPFIYFQF